MSGSARRRDDHALVTVVNNHTAYMLSTITQTVDDSPMYVSSLCQQHVRNIGGSKKAVGRLIE